MKNSIYLLGILLLAYSLSNAQGRVFESSISLDPVFSQSELFTDAGSRDAVLLIRDKKQIDFYLLDENLKQTHHINSNLPSSLNVKKFIGYSKSEGLYYFTFVMSRGTDLGYFRVDFDNQTIGWNSIPVRLMKGDYLTFCYSHGGGLYLWFSNNNYSGFQIKKIKGPELTEMKLGLTDDTSLSIPEHRKKLGFFYPLEAALVYNTFFRGKKKIRQYSMLKYNDPATVNEAILPTKFYIAATPFLTMETDSATILFRFDLEEQIIRVEKFDHDEGKGLFNSFVHDDKIIQSKGDNSGFSIRITDINTYESIREYQIGDSLYLKNTPVYKINTAFGVKNKPLPVNEKFLNHYSHLGARLAVCTQHKQDKLMMTYAIGFQNLIEPFIPLPVAGNLFIIYLNGEETMVDNVCYFRTYFDCNYNFLPEETAPPLKIYSSSNDLIQKLKKNSGTDNLYAINIFRHQGEKYIGYHLMSGILNKYFIDKLDDN